MPVGLELRRETSNSLILSNNLRNPNLVASGSIAPASVPTTGKIRAVRSAAAIHRWGSAWRGPGIVTVPYYNFADIGPDSTNIGLEIYADSVGSPIQFATHPNNKPLRVIDVIPSIGHPLAAPGGPDIEHADYSALVTQGRLLAFTQGIFAGARIWENFAINPGTGISEDLYWTQAQYARAFYIDATGKLFSTYSRTSPPTNTIIGTGPSSTPPGSNQHFDNPMLMVIDVTGY